MNALLEAESWKEKLWKELDDSNNRLSAICSAITLSEELLAIAESFVSLAEATSVLAETASVLEEPDKPRYFKAALRWLEREEKKTVNKLYGDYGDFGVQCYEIIKKVRKQFHEEANITEILGEFLQGIQQTSDTVLEFAEIVDSKMRFKILAKKAATLKNIGVEELLMGALNR